jgi:Lysyl oxidase
MGNGRARCCVIVALAVFVVLALAAPATARTHARSHRAHAKHDGLKQHAKRHLRSRRHRGRPVKAPHRVSGPSTTPLTSPGSASTADTPAPTASDPPLQPGAFRFWQGPTVASGDVPNAAACGVAGPCYSWPLNVGAGGSRLRVALDTPMRSNTFELDVIDPSGNVTSATNSNAFDVESYLPKPAAGTWTIRVMPQNVSYASFRMRAKLEGAPAPAPTGHVPLLPDLAADPPTEFTFVAPANPANGLYPPDTVNPPLDIFGLHPLSCTADEMAPTDVQGGAATRCLRFTSGPMDIGAGPYEMHFNYTQDIVNGQIASPIAHGPIFQTIHYADGTTSSRPAGTYSFHVIHGHFHDDGVLSMELLKVGADHTLTKVGVGTKSGFCPANQLLGNWRSFDNQPPNGLIGSGDVGTGNCQNPADGVLGLSPGWGDVYRWQRPGMYVEFGTQPDGLYVVRMTIDAGHEVLESSYANNSAYALVKVQGDHVQEIERGQGLSPWDPHKIVFTGAGPASRD